jgi:hypothetical protein
MKVAEDVPIVGKGFKTVVNSTAWVAKSDTICNY